MDVSVRGPASAPAPTGTIESVDLPQLLRLAGMTKALLTEVADLTLDDAARARLAGIQQRALAAIAHVFPDDMAHELADLSAPASAAPTDGELRVVQAQLVGWLNGAFQAFQLAAVERQLQLDAPDSPAPGDDPIGSNPSPRSGPYL
jgi:hypothetical protein